jgi:hypothetical protein
LVFSGCRINPKNEEIKVDADRILVTLEPMKDNDETHFK